MKRAIMKKCFSFFFHSDDGFVNSTVYNISPVITNITGPTIGNVNTHMKGVSRKSNNIINLPPPEHIKNRTIPDNTTNNMILIEFNSMFIIIYLLSL